MDLGTAARLGLAGAGVTGALRYGCRTEIAALPGNLLARTSAFLRPNIDARQAAGPVDWTAKAYFAGHLPQGVPLQAGDVIGFASTHVLAVAAA